MYIQLGEGVELLSVAGFPLIVEIWLCVVLRLPSVVDDTPEDDKGFCAVLVEALMLVCALDSTNGAKLSDVIATQ